jgi:flagellar basal-body rod modification protein FlgD
MSVSTDYNAAGTFDVQAAAAEAYASASPTGNQMGREEFLQLLVAQLSHQDPLNPLQGHEFAAQLAQFSSVEQLINLNEGVAGQAELSNLLAQSVNSGVAAGLIGKTIDAATDTMTVKGGVALEAGVHLPSAAAGVTITIRNSADQIVRTIDLGAQAGGTTRFTWDGKSDAGATVPDGDYTFEISATDANGDAVASSPIVSGVVSRVTFSQEGIKLWVGDTPIAMGAVTSVQ